MPTRSKHPRLPNGYGSIRYLGKKRKNPYAVHPPADIDGNRPQALCYVDTWMKEFRNQMDELLHFSRLCEKYEVKENDRKRMLGHSFSGDITNRVYGH